MKDGAKLFLFEHNGLSLATRALLAIAGNDKGASLLTGGHARSLLTNAGFYQVSIEYISFFPTFFGPLLAMEPHLKWCPLGAQFLAMGTRSSNYGK